MKLNERIAGNPENRECPNHIQPKKNNTFVHILMKRKDSK